MYNFTFDKSRLVKDILIHEDVEYIYLKFDLDFHIYRYSYSFDGDNWHSIDIDLYSYKLSDDYIRGGGFFTGAFVGMQCQDISGQNIPADFDYFIFKEHNDYNIINKNNYINIFNRNLY